MVQGGHFVYSSVYGYSSWGGAQLFPTTTTSRLCYSAMAAASSQSSSDQQAAVLHAKITSAADKLAELSQADSLSDTKKSNSSQEK